MGVRDILERMEQVTAAVHGPDGHRPDPNAENLSTLVGITTAVLGVLLALCTARVGAQRAELTRALLDQSSARAEFHAQDVKHRVAVIALQQMHATSAGTAGDAVRGQDAVRRQEALRLAGTVERYLGESVLARSLSGSFDSLVDAHADGEEGFESAQLAFEMGIVLASVALLMRRRAPWALAVGLGAVAIGLMGQTSSRMNGRVREARLGIERSSAGYASARQLHRTTDAELGLVADVRRWAESREVHVR